MNYDRHRRLRKVAVLVASLGEPLARPLLDDLSPRDADEVRTTVEQLGIIDPEERQDILDEFIHTATLSQRAHSDAVELDASLLEKIQQKPDEQFPSTEPTAATNPRWLVDAQPSVIAQLLANEHPQTAAVVIARLPADQAAQVLQALAPTLQSDLLARLAHLDTTDQEAMDVVATHLHDQIDQHQQRQQRMAAGLELVNDILKQTAPEQQTVLLKNLTHRDPTLAKRFGVYPKTRLETLSLKMAAAGGPENWNDPPVLKGALNSTQPKEPPKPFSHVAQSRYASHQAVSLQAAIASARNSTSQASAKKTPSPVRKVDIPKVDVTPQQAEIANPMDELEQCDDASLLAAIGCLEHRTVSLALTGASDRMLKRILRRLPRSQAKLFRKQLQVSGPTRLSEMFAAQQELLTTTWQFSGRTQ